MGVGRTTCNVSDLKKLLDCVNDTIQTKDEVLEQLTREIGLRLLRAVRKRTPVGDYSGLIVSDYSPKKHGGELRRGWSIGEVQHTDGKYVIEIINNVKYAPYVEYGHRQEPGRYVPALGKRLKSGWVKGRFMLTISEQELNGKVDSIIKKRLEAILKDVFK